MPRSLAQEARPGSLFLDISDALGKLMGQGTPLVLFANVNRGILVEEQAALRYVADVSDVGPTAKEMINWLAAPPEESATGGEASASGTLLDVLVSPGPTRPYYGLFRARLKQRGGARDALVHVVFLDTLSLLEPAPIAGESAIDFQGSTPVAGEYQPLGVLSGEGVSRNEVAAGKLLAKLVEAAEWESGGCIDSSTRTRCTAYPLCPLAQNARWLRDPQLAERFLDTLRAVEIAAARRLTYRDLLGNLSLALLGHPEQDWLKGVSPCQWVEARTRAISGSADERSQPIVELAAHRVYANMFPDGDLRRHFREDASRRNTVYGAIASRLATTTEPAKSRSFSWSFATIDPARDLDPWSGVRSRTLDAVEALEVVLPAEQVAAWQEVPAAASSDIERYLDEALRGEIGVELDNSARSQAAARRARLLRKWRSVGLLRFVGLAIGQFAFRSVVQSWLEEHQAALIQGPPAALSRGVRALILPSVTDEFVFAPLRPRTLDLASAAPKNTLLVSVPAADLRVVLVPRGDSLLAEVRMLPSGNARTIGTVASLVVDLAIAREALLHAGGRSSSFTEVGESAFARIERVLASLVGRDRLKQPVLTFIDDQGQSYRVVASPGRGGQFRVQAV